MECIYKILTTTTILVDLNQCYVSLICCSKNESHFSAASAAAAAAAAVAAGGGSDVNEATTALVKNNANFEEIFMCYIRDAFIFKSNVAPTVKKMLLELVELSASAWQLPTSAVQYYYNNNNNQC